MRAEVTRVLIYAKIGRSDYEIAVGSVPVAEYDQLITLLDAASIGYELDDSVHMLGHKTDASLMLKTRRFAQIPGGFKAIGRKGSVPLVYLSSVPKASE